MKNTGPNYMCVCGRECESARARCAVVVFACMHEMLAFILHNWIFISFGIGEFPANGINHSSHVSYWVYALGKNHHHSKYTWNFFLSSVTLKLVCKSSDLALLFIGLPGFFVLFIFTIRITRRISFFHVVRLVCFFSCEQVCFFCYFALLLCTCCKLWNISVLN